MSWRELRHGLTWHVGTMLGGGDAHSWRDTVPAGAPKFVDDEGAVMSFTGSVGGYFGGGIGLACVTHYHLYFNTSETTIGTLGVALTWGQHRTRFQIGPGVSAISAGMGESIGGGSIAFDALIMMTKTFGLMLMADLDVFDNGDAHTVVFHTGVGVGFGR